MQMTIDLPETMTFLVDGTEYGVKTGNWSPEFVLDQIEQGCKIRLQRAGAGKGDKNAARKTVVDNLNAGEIGKKASDPTNAALKALGKLSPEQQTALIAMLQAQSQA